MMESPSVRPEQAGDATAIHRIHLAAFATGAEARLVNALCASGCTQISLVAEHGKQIVGHILFTLVTPDQETDIKLMGLAPLAILPEHQGRGAGSALVRAGIAVCEQQGVDGVVVLGHPQFYPRFGFASASHFGLRSEYEVPDEVFMALELNPGALKNVQGIVRYHPAFAAL